MVRAVRGAMAGILLATLSACMVCQATRAATWARYRTGGARQIGELTVRQVRPAHQPDGVYRPDDRVAMRLAVVKSGIVGDQLTDITGPDFGGVLVGDPFSTSSVRPRFLGPSRNRRHASVPQGRPRTCLSAESAPWTSPCRPAKSSPSARTAVRPSC